eukprot:GHVT01009986.1.p1 GENE.GHVT01009986.1~~GHVT01009986.1.p1  ORF type:complete len:170 (+),score=51.53 GHVT01009986.1:757-1266(+)
MVRTSLLPGLLKALAAHKGLELPIKFFEVGDVVRCEGSEETGARNQRRVAFLYAGGTGSGLEEVHGVLDVLLSRLSLSAAYADEEEKKKGGEEAGGGRRYELVPAEDSSFFPGRMVKIVMDPGAIVLGSLGILHPTVVKAFGLTLATSVVEFSLSPFAKFIPSWLVGED